MMNTTTRHPDADHLVGWALAGMVFGLVVVLAAQGVEPKYRGRTLTSWLQQYSDTPLMETQRLAEAESAIRAIGAPKALPMVLSLVKSKDGRARAWIMEKAKKYRVRDL